LAAAATEPAFVFGASLGAMFGLSLITRHCDQVRLLIAHEPRASDLLPEPEPSEAVRRQEAIEECRRREGIGAAMRNFVVLAGLNFEDREHEVSIREFKPERTANLAFFLTHDAPAVRHYRMDLPALRAVAARIVPAAGNNSRAAESSYRCARALALEP
jgi:pimeloyl-ACP methyl ester carboxylesterase